MRAFIIIGLALLFSVKSTAQIPYAFPGKKTRILFLVDGSGSMLTPMTKGSRWEVAGELITKIVDSLRSINDVEIGLRVFGHTKRNILQDCNDTKLEIPFGPYNHKMFRGKMKSIRPLGYTSITQSLLATEQDFPADDNARNVVILVTDGVEECPGDPCEVSKLLQEKGIILRPFIVGLGTDANAFKKIYSCAGKYYNAETAPEFNKIMGVIISQVLNNTSAQINLLDEQGRPTETDAAVTFFDRTSGERVEHFMHTMNGRGLPDTIYLDPMRQYDMLVHTLPPIRKENISLIGGMHNTIAVDAARGDLYLKISGNMAYPWLKAIVKKKGDCDVLYDQSFNRPQRYLTGFYDVEVLTTPRMVFKNINISQNNTTTLDVPGPGLLQLSLRSDVKGSLFLQKEDNSYEWVADLPENRGNHDLYFQPGNYEVVYRKKGETRTLYSKKTIISIKSGLNTKLAI